MNEFRTFIASSLKDDFSVVRNKIVQALVSLNDDPDLQPLDFSSYRFETEGTNVACVEGCQNNINLNIPECHGFVLICDSNIGMKTVEEFEEARLRFNRHLNPSFVIILKSKVFKPCGPNQITFEKFKADYLTLFDYNHDGKINDDVIGYEFEFDDIDKACQKLKEDLKKWLISADSRPLFKAELGRDITPAFLYKDSKRIEGCKDRMYFRRNFDNRLHKAIKDKEQAILIKGSSLSGKTRALYQAIKDNPDTWFYKFKERHDKTEIVKEIMEIADYLRFSNSQTPLYLIFDDIHQMPSSMEIDYAVERLMDAIQGKNIRIIMTSTSADEQLIHASLTLEINSLSRNECAEAEIFFRRFGKIVETGYKEIGAMMIDLKGMKVSYDKFTKIDDKYKVKARTCLIYAIKGSSIWHNSNLGNVKDLYDFTCYLLYNEKSIKREDIPELAFDSINDLLLLPGINGDESAEEFEFSLTESIPSYIHIEEYIYRYILAKLSVEKEWQMVDYILSFVDKYKSESLIVCLSKIARRAENQKETASLIYELVTGLYNGNERNFSDRRITSLIRRPWYKSLQIEIEEIRNEVISNLQKQNEECSDLCIFMAKIIWVRMLLEETYEGAEKIFNSVNFPLQNLPMLGVLIFKSAGNQEKLNNIIKDREIERSLYIINKMIPYASDFDQALSYFKKGEIRFSSDDDYIRSTVDFRKMQEERNIEGERWEELKLKNINRQHLILSLNTLATKVGSIGDLEKLLEVIREYYVYLLDDLEYAKNYIKASDIYSRDKLTMIDLLSCLNFYGVRGAFKDIFTWGNQIPADLYDITDSIIQEYTMTSSLTTIGYKAKQTVSTIFNVFIEKCGECQFQDVMESIFLKMQVQRGNEVINLCDSYTYSGILRNRNCKYIDAIDLYNNFIEPHSKDPKGHFIITHFVLNEILNKVRSVSEYNRINRIFVENNVTKDIYTYNNVLRNLPYSMGINQILPQMYKDGVEFDIYTLGTLVSKAPNIRIATSFFDPLARQGIRSEDNLVAEGDVKRTLEKKIEEYTKILPLESQHYLWATLVESYCRNEEDRDVLFLVLEYLEKPENKSRIFGEIDNGIIYNNCLKNRSFIRNYDEAERFIASKKITPDTYTLGQLLKIIIDEYRGAAGYEQDITYYLNDIYRRNKNVVIKEIKHGNTHLYNERLKAYKSHADKLSFLFIYLDGTEEILSMTPMEYLRNLIAKKLPVDQYTLSCFSSIEKGQTYELLEEFIEFVRINNLYVNHYAIDNLVRQFKNKIPENKRVMALGAIYELPIKDNIISHSKATVNMYSHELCSLEEAFRRVVGNPTEKLYCYTQLFSLFRKFQLSKQRVTVAISEDFRLCMELYKQFIKNDKIKTNADLFSNLANFATDRSELEEVLNEMKTEGVKPISYILTPILRVSRSLDDVKELIQKYIYLGGAVPGRVGSEAEVDAILHGLGILLRKNRDADIHRIIEELTEYALSSAPSSNVLADFPAFRIYKTENEGDRLTQNALCELINYWPELEDNEASNEKYLKNTAALLAKYYHPENDAIRPQLVQAIKCVADNRQISCVDILNVLKPYPKLAFMFASQKLVDEYEAYKILVESWNDSFERISQVYVIGVLMTQLESKGFSSTIWKILPGIFKKWKNGITTRDFLKEDDDLQTVPAVVTEYAENDRLRRKYLKSRFKRFIKKCESTKEEKIDLYIELFKDEMSDASFVKSELGGFIKDHKLKFNDIKPILEAVTGNKDSVAALLCHMTDKMESYANLYYMIDIICSESVEIPEELGQRLVFGVMRKKYDDYKFKLIAEQILIAIDEDRLQLNDLLYIPTTLSRESLEKRLKIPRDLKAQCKLLYILSNGMGGLSSHGMIDYAEDIICRYYCSLEERKSLIDTLIVQELLRLYVNAHNKHDDAVFMEKLLKRIEDTMSVHISGEIDASVLFSDESKARLNKGPFWYKIKSRYISRMLLRSLNCCNRIKLDMIISAECQEFWWSNAFKGQFDVLMSYVPEVEESIDNSRPEEFIKNLFFEARKPEEFIHALKLVLSGRTSFRNESIIVDSLLRIIGKEENYAYRLVCYNDRLYKKFGKSSSLTDAHSSWIPNSEFFNSIFGGELLDKSADYVLEDLFCNMSHMKPISRFVCEMRIMKAMKDPKLIGLGFDMLKKHISINQTYFDLGGKIDNDLLIATYIKVTKSTLNIVKKIMEKSIYNASMLSSFELRNDIFDDSMGHHVFKELCFVVERNRERGYSRVTSQKLLHKLLLGCGNEFIMENPHLLVEVANTIKTLDEYRKFTNDLMSFYLPISSELTAALIEVLMSLEVDEKKNWLFKKVLGRVRALAEFDHYHQGTDCHAFKAGYFLLQQEANIEFKHFWTKQNLHLKDPGTEETLRKILSYRFFDRIYAVMAIDSIDLKCELMLKLYVNNMKLNYNENNLINEKLNQIFNELAGTMNSSDALSIKLNSIFKIFKVLTKNEIKVPNELNKRMLLGLVRYYQLQLSNENLGNYYKNTVSYVLKQIAEICEKNKELEKIKIYYGLFTNNKTKGKVYFLCETKSLMKVLK